MPLDDDARQLLGGRLLAARRAAGLTATELCERLPPGPRGERPTKNVISQYESGLRLPSLDRLAELAAALGTSASALLDGVQIDE